MASLSDAEMIKDKVVHMSELAGERVFMLAHGGDVNAKREILRREIMCVDKIPYTATTEVLLEINSKTESALAVQKPATQFLIYFAQFSGWAAIPMVFSLTLVKAFNEKFVTMDLPEPSDLDTILETGSWAWNWMEPPLGTISFTLLCLQWAAEQRKILGLKSVGDYRCESTGSNVCAAYPKYNASVLRSYVEAIALQGDREGVEADHKAILDIRKE